MDSKKFQFLRLGVLMVLFLGLQQCCTSKENVQNENEIKMNSLKKIPNGAADLTFKFLEIKDLHGVKKIHGVVEKIHGYGSQIRPLAEGNIYDFDFDNMLLDQIRENIGKTLKIRITSIPQMRNNNHKSNYKILSIEN